MFVNSSDTHLLKPMILNRDEIASYMKSGNHQHYIIAPCASELDFETHSMKDAKLFINERRMLAAAKQLTLKTTSWVTVQDLQCIRTLNSDVPLEHPNDWIAAGRVFAVKIAEQEFIPLYALDLENNFSPYNILLEVLKVFAAHKNSWGVAFWFSSLCGFLAGQRPQDLLKNQPQLVLDAAKDEAAGVTHG
jgi:hypothetical protein